MMDHPTRRGNYDSGQDYVLEYGDLRFTFNERDFSERVEQAALKLGFVGGRLESTELEDLVNLTVNGEVSNSFGYVQPERDREPIELSPEPNWGRVAYMRR